MLDKIYRWNFLEIKECLEMRANTFKSKVFRSVPEIIVTMGYIGYNSLPGNYHGIHVLNKLTRQRKQLE